MAGADINEPDINDHTPLVQAIYYERTSVAELLISKGAELYSTVSGHSCLELAISSQSPIFIIELLLANGAKINAMTPSGQTPLHVAVSYGNYLCIPTLLNYGASVTLKNQTHELNAFEFALSRNEAQVFKSMIHYFL